MPGDKEFRWYWGAGEHPTKWNGTFDTADAAAVYARGHHPRGDYTLIKADRHSIDADVFIADDILAALGAANADCWPDGIPAAAQSEMAELQAKLSDCLDRWVRKRGYDTTTAVHEIRTRDYFGPAPTRLTDHG